MNETRRILALPVTISSDTMVTGQLDRVIGPAAALLRLDQRRCLETLRTCNGLVAQLVCGGGKGLVSMLAPRIVGAQRPLILVPARLLDTFHAEWAKFYSMGFPLPPVTVWSHTDLSQPKATDALERLAPDLIFIDEAHAFRRSDAARTRRLLRYLDTVRTRPHGGLVVFAIASGTITSASLLDFAHLFWHALGPQSPVPRTDRAGKPSSDLQAWANMIDANGEPDHTAFAETRMLVEAFAPELLAAFCNGHAKESARIAFERRSATAAGIVRSIEPGTPCSLVIERVTNHPVPVCVTEALRAVEAGETPDGGELFATPVAEWRAGIQVSTGFFYRWDWSRVGRTTPDEVWLDARRSWHKALRAELRNAHAGYDSPALVERAILANTQHPLWPTLNAWKAVDRYNVDHLRETIWLSDYLLQEIVWLALQQDTVVWYASEAVETRLRLLGLRCFGAGSTAPTGGSCGLSLWRHGTGANLQDRWSTAIFAEFPSSGEQAEQALARLHRPGQRADEVSARVYTHTPPLRLAWESATEKARYMAHTQGPQRLLYATKVSVV